MNGFVYLDGIVANYSDQSEIENYTDDSVDEGDVQVPSQSKTSNAPVRRNLPEAKKYDMACPASCAK